MSDIPESVYQAATAQFLRCWGYTDHPKVRTIVGSAITEWERVRAGEPKDNDGCPMPTCPECGAYHQLVRPGKTQPSCACEDYHRAINDLRSMENQRDAVMEEARVNQRTLQNDLAAAQAELESGRNSIGHLQTQVRRLIDERKDLEDRLQTKRDQNHDIRKQLEVAQAKVGEMEQRIENLRLHLRCVIVELGGVASAEVTDQFLAMVPAEAKAHEARLKQAEEALRKAEAALADIGDAQREPDDDLAWCERRAAEALPAVRAALKGKPPIHPAIHPGYAKIGRKPLSESVQRWSSLGNTCMETADDGYWVCFSDILAWERGETAAVKEADDAEFAIEQFLFLAKTYAFTSDSKLTPSAVVLANKVRQAIAKLRRKAAVLRDVPAAREGVEPEPVKAVTPRAPTLSIATLEHMRDHWEMQMNACAKHSDAELACLQIVNAYKTAAFIMRGARAIEASKETK